MAALAAFAKLPAINSATVLLVGTNEDFQEQLAETMLKEKEDFKVNIHLTRSLPLPAERDHIRPRIDLIVFMINVKSKYSFNYHTWCFFIYFSTSFKDIESSLRHVDANFFLGKVCFLVIGACEMNQISVDVDTVLKLADCYCSPVLFCELECENTRISTARQLLRMLQICAGHVSGVSALSFSSLMGSYIDYSSIME
ncbi:centromere protein M isoform X1 [Podarcis raffonei]|uniref:centromere protein M isoform X1 n=1 Tax=Podarcis raffonei TaxID=65483 RepID=UPI0023295BF1|nr:centromere protein M isoform X1 [Podarcis raffonei]